MHLADTDHANEGYVLGAHVGFVEGLELQENGPVSAGVAASLAPCAKQIAKPGEPGFDLAGTTKDVGAPLLPVAGRSGQHTARSARAFRLEPLHHLNINAQPDPPLADSSSAPPSPSPER